MAVPRAESMDSLRGSGRQERGTCCAACCSFCRPSHVGESVVAGCSLCCACKWFLFPFRLGCGCLYDQLTCKGCRGQEFPEWNCVYTMSLGLMQRMARAAPTDNVYCLQLVTDTGTPAPMLPSGFTVQRVNDRATGVKGEWWTAKVPKGMEQPRRTIMYFHGGAYVLCRAKSERMIGAALLESTGHCRIFAADYRRPPADPFPAPLEDAVAAYTWLRKQVPADEIIVAGDSAGGNLALALLFRLQQLGVQQPAGALLFSPWVQMFPFETDSWGGNARWDYIAERNLVDLFAGLYLGSASDRDPFVAPCNATAEQLSRLPPMWVSVGGAEVLRSSIQAFTDAASTAGASVEVFVGDGMPHVFQLFSFSFAPPRREFLPRICCCCGSCADPATKHPVWEAYRRSGEFVASVFHVRAEGVLGMSEASP
eukprot:TRINITY_DN4475_c0_g1_i2.p1 TRINITY_DN4475_c0_g1~~TRINITY_DN4475_c0_g1_i2.p1  ORF type:complete len:442 (+),score=141.93 TRINITY_DN4475_c0_g1_i2:54-1328(+)